MSELKALLADAVHAPRPQARIDGVLALDRAVALAVRSPALLAIREGLAERLTGLLMPQDRRPVRLHITVQNKVPVAVVRATLAELRGTILSRPLEITGLACWFYRGGPWSPIARYSFWG